MFTLRVTDDIELRLVDMYQVEQFYQVIDANRAYIGEHLPWPEFHQSMVDTENYVRDARRGFAEKGQIAMMLLYQGQIAGGIGLHLRDARTKSAEIGYWLAQEFTGKGLITQGTQAIVDYAIDTLQMHKVFIRCSTKNPKSCAIPARLGFKEEGTLIHEGIVNDEYLDMRHWYVLADEWQIQQHGREFAHRIDDKLELRLFRPEQAEILFNVIDDNREHLREWLGFLDRTLSADDTLNFITSGLKQYADYNGIQCGIWYEGALVGAIGYHYWDVRHGKTEIGYWLAQASTGKGIMTRAVTALIDYAFDIVKLHRIEIPCGVGNERSCAIPRRLGFTHEGVIRNAEWLYDHYVDLNMFSMLDHEWRADV